VVIPAAKAGISEVGSGFDPAPTHLHAIRKYGHIVTGAFTPILAKHTNHLSLVDILAVGVDRMRPVRLKTPRVQRRDRSTWGRATGRPLDEDTQYGILQLSTRSGNEERQS